MVRMIEFANIEMTSQWISF